MKDFGDKLNEILDLTENVSIAKPPIERKKVDSTNDDVDNDYIYARENM